MDLQGYDSCRVGGRCLRLQPDHCHAAATDGSGEFAVELTQILLPPQVADGCLAGDPQVRPFGGDFGVLCTAIEQPDGLCRRLRGP